MATGFHDDKLPLIDEEETNTSGDWQHVPSLVNGDQHGSEVYNYSLDEDQDDEDNEEIGVKGVADVDCLPEGDGCIELQKGDIVIIHGQTIDQKYFQVVNLRNGQHGEVPCQNITLECSDDFEPLPAKSNLQRGNVIRRKRSTKSRDKSRRTGSDFTASFPLPSRGLEEPSPISCPATSTITESSRVEFVKSESHINSLPVQYRRIEKYRVLSISGTDKMGRPVIVFSACRLPPSYQISHEVLFDYVKYLLDQYVESDYTLVYFHHGLTSVNKPSYGWLYQFYKELDRKYKKNLKRLYVVHPTTFVKFMMGLFRPVISYKFGKKLVYINRLAELDSVLFTDQMEIPEEVSRHDKQLRTQPRSYLQAEGRSSFYVPINESLEHAGASLTSQFGVNLKALYERSGEEIPVVMKKCVEYLSNEGLEVLGIFRRTPSHFTVQDVKKKFNLGEDVDFATYGDPHLAATTLKMFLRELPEPLLCFSTISKISQLRFAPDDKRVSKCKEIVDALPPLNYNILNYLLCFITKIVEHEDVNKMSSTNLSIVLGPNLLWSQNEVASLNSMSEINRFTLLIIDNYNDIFVKQ